MNSLKTFAQIEVEAHNAFRDFGFAKETIRPMMAVVRKILRKHKEYRLVHFDKGIVSSYIKNEEMRYIANEIGRSKFFFRKKAAEYLVEIQDSGNFTYMCYNHSQDLTPFFEEVLNCILNNPEWNGKTAKRRYDVARPFLKWLSAQGHIHLANIDEQVLREYLMVCSQRMTGASLDNVRRGLRQLCLFWFDAGLLPSSHNEQLLFSVPKMKKIKRGIPQDDIASMLNVIDRKTVKGKRDYAIIMLGTITGLRAADIIGLCFESIDWRNGEIKIIQAKTEQPLALPLTVDVSEAVTEYILDGRPDSNLSNIFLNLRSPFGTISRHSINACLKLYQEKAGLSSPYTFHDLRRSIATNMVTSGIPVSTVAQVLGHSTIDSTKQYISLDVEHLRECSLDFSGIGIGVNAK